MSVQSRSLLSPYFASYPAELVVSMAADIVSAGYSGVKAKRRRRPIGYCGKCGELVFCLDGEWHHEDYTLRHPAVEPVKYYRERVKGGKRE